MGMFLLSDIIETEMGPAYVQTRASWIERPFTGIWLVHSDFVMKGQLGIIIRYHQRNNRLLHEWHCLAMDGLRRNGYQTYLYKLRFNSVDSFEERLASVFSLSPTDPRIDFVKDIQ